MKEVKSPRILAVPSRFNEDPQTKINFKNYKNEINEIIDFFERRYLGPNNLYEVYLEFFSQTI